jgi:hypothetical protein
MVVPRFNHGIYEAMLVQSYLTVQMSVAFKKLQESYLGRIESG